ncbi:MAG: hypothetical protein AB8B95_00255 [Pseudohongiellaceae bacterium]
MFLWLETTSIARWVGESYYAYPALLSVHIIGLAIVVGLSSMRDLKLLGLFPAVQLHQLAGLKRIALGGFLLNVFSGFLLFSSQASYLISSLPFVLKIGLVTAGMVLTIIINRQVAVAGESSQQNSKQHRILAVASLLIWLAAIVAGRLIAYV